PVFFAYSGLKVDLFALHGLGLLALVVGIAIAGKLIGWPAGGPALRAQAARIARSGDRNERARRDGNHRRADRPEPRGTDAGDVRDHRHGRDHNFADDAAALELDALRGRTEARRDRATGARKATRTAAVHPRGRETA